MERGFFKRFVTELTGIIRGEAVLVYTMGKVGSSTLERSLKLTGIITIHMHDFSGKPSNFRDHRLDKVSLGVWFFHVAYKVRLRIFSIAIRIAPRVRIISMVRDPVARNLSSMFQGLDRLIFQATQLDANTPEENMLQYIFDHYVNHERASSWFYDEFRRTTGIDIDQFPPAKRSVLNAENGRYSALIIKLEALNDCEKEISRFLGLQEFKLIRSNDSSAKWYGPLYVEFKKNLELSTDYLEQVYKASYLRRFYSDSEIEEMKERWAKNVEIPGK